MTTSALDVNLSEETVKKILHGIIDSMLGLPNLLYSEFCDQIQLEAWWSYTKTCRDLIIRCSSSSMTSQQIEENYGQSLTVRCLQEVIHVRRNDLKLAIANDACACSATYLKDFDWDVQLILGSDKMAVIQEPTVSVKFDLREHGSPKEATFEMNEKQLDDFIDVLEQAAKETVHQHL